MITGAFFKTDAPAAYDGFGTTTIQDDHEGNRVVWIHAEHQTWQIGRYASGMYSALLIPAFLEAVA